MSRVTTALCLLTGALALSACSQDGAAETTSAPAAPTAAATSAPVLAPVSTPAATPRRSTATSAPRTSATPAPRKTTSAPANPDGSAYALLDYVGPDRVIRYDKVDYLPAACDRRTENQYADATATLRICFRNTNPRLRTVQVSKRVVIGNYTPDGGVESESGITYDDLRRDVADPYPLSEAHLPVRLTIKGGVVTRIDEAALLAG